jgi:DNA primase
VIARLRDAADIVAVIGEVTTLRKAGRNYMGLCPFHGEKTPSFSVSRDKGTYYCFGCRRGGDVIDFLMEFHHLSFAEAVERLAAQFGVELPPASPAARRRRSEAEILQQVMEAAQAFFAERLGEDRPRSYLERRGVSLETAASFGLGYAPADWRQLYDALRGKFPERALLAAGLVLEGESGRVWDRFRDRVTIPIRSVRGRVIAFGGRALGDEQPKYLNSPETPLFAKSSVLYCLDRALPAFARAERAVVVEGYFDCIALQALGIHEAVATLGTALSAQHARELARRVPRVVVCFDGDEAGRKAALAAVRTLLAADVEPYVALLPEGLDPDDLARREGRAAVEELLAKALHVSNFLVAQLGDTPRQRRASLAAVLEVADASPDPVRRYTLREVLATSAGVPLEQLGELAAPRVVAQASANHAEPPLAELALLRWLLVDSHPAQRARLASFLAPEAFSHSGTRLLAEQACAALQSKEACSLEGLLATLEDAEARRVAAAVEHLAPTTPESRQGEWVRVMLVQQLSASLSQAQGELEEAIRRNDREAMARCTGRIASLQRLIPTLRDPQALASAWTALSPAPGEEDGPPHGGGGRDP